MGIHSVFAAAGIVLLAFGAAQAQSVATDASGRTLYTFDQDSGGTSSCYDQCAVNWPPVLGQEGSEMGPDWSLVPRNDGTMQMAYKGKPVYYYIGDQNPGDVTGDGKGGVWHVLTP